MSRYRVWLCPPPSDSVPLVIEGDCSDRDKHAPAPAGYLEWHEWVTTKAKTHRQKQCPTCGLWAVWVPKKKRAKVNP